jgi:DNA-binding beta-propeller fold protein YncE
MTCRTRQAGGHRPGAAWRLRGVLAGTWALVLGSGCPPPDVRFERDTWPTPSLPAVDRPRLLVTNSEDDTVSFLLPDALGDGELLRLPVGLSPVEREGPHHAALSPDGRWFAVPLTFSVPGEGGGPHAGHGNAGQDGALVVVDARTGVRRGQVRVDVNPGDVLAAPDGRTVYVSHFDLARIQRVLAANGPVEDMVSRLLVVDVESLTVRARVPLCPAAHGMALSPDGRRLYASCLSDEVAVVDLTRPELPVTRVPLHAQAGDPRTSQHGPYALAVSPSNGEVWVSCPDAKDVHVLRPDTLTVDAARTRRVPGMPYFGQVTADGALLHLATQAPDLAITLDTATGAVTRTVPLGDAGCTRAHQLMLLPGEAEAVVVCEGPVGEPGALLGLDVAAGAVRHLVPLGLRPDSVGLLPPEVAP